MTIQKIEAVKWTNGNKSLDARPLAQDSTVCLLIDDAVAQQEGIYLKDLQQLQRQTLKNDLVVGNTGFTVPTRVDHGHSGRGQKRISARQQRDDAPGPLTVFHFQKTEKSIKN